MTRRLLLSVVLAALLSVFACAPALVGGAAADSVAATTETVPPATPDPASVGTNPFIPENVNIGDCVSSMPRPDCGTKEQGGWHQYLTMLVLVMGTAFIAWRIARSVRSRDRAMTPPPNS